MSLPNLSTRTFFPAVVADLPKIQEAWKNFADSCEAAVIAADPVVKLAKKKLDAICAECAECEDLERGLKVTYEMYPKLTGLVTITGKTPDEIYTLDKLYVNKREAIAEHEAACKVICKARDVLDWAHLESQICDAFCLYMETGPSLEEVAAHIKAVQPYYVHASRGLERSNRKARLAYWEGLR